MFISHCPGSGDLQADKKNLEDFDQYFFLLCVVQPQFKTYEGQTWDSELSSFGQYDTFLHVDFLYPPVSGELLELWKVVLGFFVFYFSL